MRELSYRDAGVDIDEGNRAVELMRGHVARTARPGVVGGIGGFGGLFAPDLTGYHEPVLVAGADGVGTKLKIAFALDRHDTVGIDLVAMSADDVVCRGARPLFFVDYIGCAGVRAGVIADIVKGVAEGCVRAGCALVAGETAELPGLYRDGEYDLAGFCVGLVDRARIIDGSAVRPGDAIVGLASSGLHSNGYSLARKVLLETAGWSLERHVPEFGRTLGEELLEPTRIYAPLVLDLVERFEVRGVAHVTGGAFFEKVPRLLPAGVGVVVDVDAWAPPPVFRLIAEIGRVARREMYRTFNMGIGMALAVPAAQADAVAARARELGCPAWTIGETVALGGAAPAADPVRLTGRGVGAP
jgi:phosphoribosylformylglycinamidine cyclo-ligase